MAFQSSPRGTGPASHFIFSGVEPELRTNRRPGLPRIGTSQSEARGLHHSSPRFQSYPVFTMDPELIHG